MGSIPINQARRRYNEVLVDIHSDFRSPKKFLSSFFKEVETDSRFVSVEVERGLELVASDIIRGAEGNRNTFSRSTVKEFDPPHYREFFDATELAVYDALFGAGEDNISNARFEKFVQTIAQKQQLLVEKIERAVELQCAQVLQTGIVQLNNGINIDYKRKAASKVVANTIGGYWDGAGDPYAQIEQMCDFIRLTGKADTFIFNATMGGLAFNALMKNTVFLQRNDLINIKLDTILTPQRNAAGALLRGELTCGQYTVRLWVYPETYEVVTAGGGPDGTPTKETRYYLDQKKVVITPEMTKFTIAYAAVPQLVTDGQKIFKGKYLFADWPDQKKATHEFDVKSCPLAIITAVDQLATLTVLG